MSHPLYPDVVEQGLKPFAKVVLARNRLELLKALPKADGLITLLSDTVDEKLLSRAPRLRVVGNYAVGVNNIDLSACTRRGIAVVNTPGVLTHATAEMALALLLAAARRMPEGERLCRAGKFRGWAPDLLLGLELRGRHAVLVGPGRIGTETARLFQALGLTAEFISRYDSPEEVNRKLARAQILSLHLPLNEQTRHWLDAKRLALLPSDAIVLNTSRGPLINEKALVRALRQRRLFAAGLDVFEREPLIEPALRKLQNVVLIPHLGSATHETREAMARLVVSGTLGILRGEAVTNQVKSLS